MKIARPFVSKHLNPILLTNNHTACCALKDCKKFKIVDCLWETLHVLALESTLLPIQVNNHVQHEIHSHRSSAPVNPCQCIEIRTPCSGGKINGSHEQYYTCTVLRWFISHPFPVVDHRSESRKNLTRKFETIHGMTAFHISIFSSISRLLII